MSFPASKSASKSRTFFTTIALGLTCMLLMGSLRAESWGVPSNNAADNPPVIEPSLDLRSTDPNRPPAYGPEDPLVLVVIFSDYKCPACRRANPATHQIATEFPDEVRIEIWQRPLEMHRGADRAALAALAAQRQGKFWEMHDLIFLNFGKTSDEQLEQHAMALDLDMEQFREDMNDPDLITRIKREHDLADQLGTRATPGWVINGKTSVGWGSWGSFRSKVERELEAARALVEQGLSPTEVREQRAIENNDNSEIYQLIYSNFLSQNANRQIEAESP